MTTENAHFGIYVEIKRWSFTIHFVFCLRKPTVSLMSGFDELLSTRDLQGLIEAKKVNAKDVDMWELQEVFEHLLSLPENDREICVSFLCQYFFFLNFDCQSLKL